MTTPNTDVTPNYEDPIGLSEAAGDDAFLASFKIEKDVEEDAPREPSKDAPEGEDKTPPADEDENDEVTDESPETEDETDDEAEAEDAKRYVDSDDAFVKVKVGDEDIDVSVKDLKRLYGQEKALTQKSQDVAAARKLADEGTAKNVAALNVLSERAKAKAAPYAALDWLAISKNPNITAEEATALRDEAKAALDDAAFFDSELGTLMTAIGEKQKTDQVAQARVCIQSLSTPSTADKPNPLHIEGWNDKVYDELRTFARELGAEQSAVDSMVDPVAFKILHMAMQFKRGSSKVLTVKTNKSPKKIVKASSSSSDARNASTPTATRKAAVTKLARSGSEADAEAAFLAGMTD